MRRETCDAALSDQSLSCPDVHAAVALKGNHRGNGMEVTGCWKTPCYGKQWMACVKIRHIKCLIFGACRGHVPRRGEL